jgi:uncharacterized protein with PIN domain
MVIGTSALVAIAAQEQDAPLLYKGDDFPLTDIRSALDA